MLLLRLFRRIFRFLPRIVGGFGRGCFRSRGGRGGVIDVVFETRRRTNGDDSGAEFDADGYVVVGNEATFAEANRQLSCISCDAEEHLVGRLFGRVVAHG